MTYEEAHAAMTEERLRRFYLQYDQSKIANLATILAKCVARAHARARETGGEARARASGRTRSPRAAEMKRVANTF